jgi:hypothetical protein
MPKVCVCIVLLAARHADALFKKSLEVLCRVDLVLLLMLLDEAF